MHAHPRIRRTAKWTGFALSLLVLSVWAASLRCSGSMKFRGMLIELDGGMVRSFVGRYPSFFSPPLRLHVGLRHLPLAWPESWRGFASGVFFCLTIMPPLGALFLFSGPRPPFWGRGLRG